MTTESTPTGSVSPPAGKLISFVLPVYDEEENLIEEKLFSEGKEVE